MAASGTFVALIEFSEQLGPTALWRMPEESARAVGEAETQRLYSNIMAVDFQSRLHHTQLVRDGSGVSCDTRVVTSDVSSGYHHYAHHFTLFDVHARGFVRPMCLGFFTRDPPLLMRSFSDLSSMSAQLSRLLKDANRDVTRSDLERRISDARFTQDLLSSSSEQSPGLLEEHFGPGGPKYKLSALKEHLADLEQFYSNLVGGQGDVGAAAATVLMTAQEKQRCRVITSVYKGQFDKTLRDVEGLCGADAARDARSMMSGILEMFSKTAEEREEEDAVGDWGDPKYSAASLSFGREGANAPASGAMINFTIAVPSDALVNGDVPLSLGNLSRDPSPVNRQCSSSPQSAVICARAVEGLPTLKLIPDAERQAANSWSSEQSILSVTSEVGPEEKKPVFLQTLASSHEELESATSPASPRYSKSTTASPACGPKHRSMTDSFSSLAMWELGPGMSPDGGPGLREILLRYSFSPHLVYSLLRGRPVVVRGSSGSQSYVSAVVTALSALVPRPIGDDYGCAVQSWRTTSVKVADLAKLRLWGSPSRLALPKAVERYSTIFTVDDALGSLIAPPYPPSGQIVDEFLSLRKTWVDETSFLAHVQECLLQTSVKAFLYYHVCCAGMLSLAPPLVETAKPRSASRGTTWFHSGQDKKTQCASPSSVERSGSTSQPVTPTGHPRTTSLTPPMAMDQVHHERSPPSTGCDRSLYTVLPVRREHREKVRAKFWRDLDIRPGDREIVRNLADVVCRQQAAELRGFHYVEPVVVDYSPCRLFRNTLIDAAGIQL